MPDATKNPKGMGAIMKKEIRESLIEVARQLFGLKGAENTTMSDIAQASGKGRRTLYTYFESKEDIYYAVIESELDRLNDMLVEIVSRNTCSQEKVIELIRIHLSMMRQVFTWNSNLQTNIYRNIWAVEKIRKHFDSVESELFENVLEEGKEGGEFEIDNIKLIANLLHYCIKGLEVPYILGHIDKGIKEEDINLQIASFFSGMLRKNKVELSIQKEQ